MAYLGDALDLSLHHANAYSNKSSAYSSANVLYIYVLLYKYTEKLNRYLSHHQKLIFYMSFIVLLIAVTFAAAHS